MAESAESDLETTEAEDLEQLRAIAATAEVESYARDNCPDLPDDFFSTE